MKVDICGIWTGLRGDGHNDLDSSISRCVVHLVANCRFCIIG